MVSHYAHKSNLNIIYLLGNEKEYVGLTPVILNTFHLRSVYRDLHVKFSVSSAYNDVHTNR